MKNSRGRVVWGTLVILALILLPATAGAQGTLFVEGDNVGIGTPTPQQDLHIQGAGVQIYMRDTSSTTGQRTFFSLENEHGGVSFKMNNLEVPHVWEFFGSNAFFINNVSNPGIEFQINPNGAIVVNGSVVHTPDYVFEPEYDLMPLDELRTYISEHKRLPNVPSAEENQTNGLNLQEFQMAMLEKVEELTLYILDQEQRIQSQGKEIERLREENLQLREVLDP